MYFDDENANMNEESVPHTEQEPQEETPVVNGDNPFPDDYFRPKDPAPIQNNLYGHSVQGAPGYAGQAQPTPQPTQTSQAYSYTAPSYPGQAQSQNPPQMQPNRNPYSYQNSAPSYYQGGNPGANQHTPYSYQSPIVQKPKKRRDRTWLIVAVVLLAFLLSVVSAAWAISSLTAKLPSPEKPDDSQVSVPGNGNDKDSEQDQTSDTKPGTTSNVIYGDHDGFDNQGTTVSGEAISNAAVYSAKSVVAITTSAAAYNPFYGNYVVEGAGSGVLWAQKATADGKVEGTYIVTNNHVISGASSITVTLSDGLDYQATLVGTDEQTDVAVILIPATDLGDSLASIGDSSKLLLGQTILAIGNPLGELAGTVTSGIISCLEREIDVSGVQMNLMQIDAAVSPGNSGGGLFNLNGQLVGIVNAKSTGDGVEGLGFAIPVNTVKKIASDLMAHGYVTGRPKIGIEGYEVTAQNYSGYQETEAWEYIKNFYYANNGNILEGWYIMNDSKVSYVDEKVTFQVGDVVAAIDGKKISTTTTITSVLEQHEIGDRITVSVWRLVPTGSGQFRKNYTIQSFDVTITLVEVSK